MGWVEIRSWGFGLYAIMFCKIYETFSNQSIHGGHRFGGIDKRFRGHASGPSRERLGRVYTLLGLG